MYRISLTLIALTAAMFGANAGAEGSIVQWKVSDGGNGHWYEARHTPLGITWSEANAAASVATGSLATGYLATITSAAEDAFVFSLVIDTKFWFKDNVGNSQGPFLGGLQDLSSFSGSTPTPSDGWEWVTGEAWSYTNWETANSEPNDSDGTENGQEDYLQLFNQGGGLGSIPIPASTWNDIPNNTDARGYVVEWETNPVPEPTTLAIWSLLGGIGLIAGHRRRRRRRKAA